MPGEGQRLPEGGMRERGEPGEKMDRGRRGDIGYSGGYPGLNMKYGWRKTP